MDEIDKNGYSLMTKPKDLTKAERIELRGKIFHAFVKRNLRKRIRSPRIEDMLFEGPVHPNGPGDWKEGVVVVKPTAHTREGFAFRHPKLGICSRRWDSLKPAEIMLAINEESGYVCPKCGAWEYRGGDAEHLGAHSCGGRWIWIQPRSLD